MKNLENNIDVCGAKKPKHVKARNRSNILTQLIKDMASD
jgi:hypothetical protein